MADDARPKRRRPSEAQMAKRREREKQRAKTRIYVGPAFERWREVRRQRGFLTDIELALYLLDRSVWTLNGRQCSPNHHRDVAN